MRTTAINAIRDIGSCKLTLGAEKRGAGIIDQCDWRSGPGLALSRWCPALAF
jgi:hypothetical protein